MLSKNKPAAVCTAAINVLETVQTVSHMLFHPCYVVWKPAEKLCCLKSPAHHIWTLADQPQNPVQSCLTSAHILQPLCPACTGSPAARWVYLYHDLNSNWQLYPQQQYGEARGGCSVTVSDHISRNGRRIWSLFLRSLKGAGLFETEQTLLL